MRTEYILDAMPADGPSTVTAVEIPEGGTFVAAVCRTAEGRYLLSWPREGGGLKSELKTLEFLLKQADDFCWDRPEHPKADVYCPLVGRSIQVGVKMKPLLRAIRGVGVMTYLSCQDNAPVGHAWIMFGSREDALWFSDVCHGVVRRGNVNVHHIGPRSVSVRFPKGKIRQLTRVLNRMAEHLGLRDDPCEGDRGVRSA